jgi:hypothetical protein
MFQMLHIGYAWEAGEDVSERLPRARSAGDVRGRGPPVGRETQAWARAWTRENGRLVSGRGRALAVPKYKQRDSTAATRKR